MPFAIMRKKIKIKIKSKKKKKSAGLDSVFEFCSSDSTAD